MSVIDRATRAAGTLLLLGLVATPLLAQPRQQPPPPQIRIDDDPAAREEYLRRQRAYPYDRVPALALQQARLQANRLRIGSPSRSATIASSWASIGPAAIASGTITTSGRVTAIAAGPAGSNIYYVGAAQGGVWKSIDGGASWTALTDAQCSLAVGAITLDPVDPRIIYVGTGEANYSGDSYYGCGVLRSTDAGASWTQLGASSFQNPAGGGARFSKVIVDPATAGTTSATLYAATSQGLFKSLDGGSSWTNILSRGYGYVSDVVMDPVNHTTLYAAATSPFTNAANGVYKTTDGGLTWSPRLDALPTTDVGRIALSISPVGSHAVYAAIEGVSGGNLLGLYRSQDQGATWTTMGAQGAQCSGQCWYNMALTADSRDSAVVYLSAFSLYRSADFGANFSDIGRSIHVDHHALAFDPTGPAGLLAGSDGGIFRSTNAGATWTSLNANLAITQFYAGVSLHPTNIFPILGGSQDNGTLEFGGAASWPPVFGGDGGFTATNFLDPNVSWVETQWSPGSGYSGPRRGDTRAGIYPLKMSGISSSDQALFIPPLVMSPAVPTTLYFGTFRLYRTRNNGEQWTPISSNLSKGSGTISAIGVSASDSQTVYVGTNDGNVQVTVDGGTTWTSSAAGIPNRYVSDIVVDPAHAEVAYVSVSGFGVKHVFRTTNRGASWTSVAGNLPDVPVNALVQIPGGDLFVGTDLGVYTTADGGGTWTKPAAGLPNVAVFDLVFHRATGTLVAATHGRSMFSLGITPNAPPTQVVVDASPRFVQSGVVSPPIAVSVREVAGTVVPGTTNAVTATITTTGGTLSGTTTVSAVNGIATFANLVVTAPNGLQTLTFTANGLAPASVVVTVIPPITLAVTPLVHRDSFPSGATVTHGDSAAVELTGPAAATTSWSATRSRASTTLITDAGTGSGVLRWRRSPAGLLAGTYVDTIVVTVAGATGSPARVIDSMIVRPPAAYAYFLPDTVRGLRTDRASIDLVADVTSLPTMLVGSYTASVVWDSTVVRLDSVRAAAAPFAAPTVNQVSAGEVRITSADPTGSAGAARLARFYFQFQLDSLGRTSLVTPSFSALSSSTNVNLLPGMFVRPATALVAPSALRGDVTADGKVTAADAQAVLQALVGLSLPAGFKSLPNGDANCNGTLQAVDAQIILSYVVGLPVGQFCVGQVR